MKPSDFLLERYFAEHEFSSPHLLCASDCETITIADVLALEDGAREQFLALRLGYTDSRGSLSLRREITALYETITPDDLLVFAGAEEAILAFMSVVLTAGDRLLAPHPAYQSLQEIARTLGADVSRVVLDEKAGWNVRADDYRILFDARTRALAVNAPHNPTGGSMIEGDFRALLDWAHENGIAVLSDEVYRLLEYDSARRLPAACDVSASAVSLGVMSKSFGLAGLRIGWLATRDRDFLRRCAAFKDYTTICSSGPSEFLAEIALRYRDLIVERNRHLIRRNLELLDNFFERHSALFSWIRPAAGPIAFPRLLTGQGTRDFCRRARTEAGVLLLPSHLFDFGDYHFRIGFGRASVPVALSRFDEWLG